ncbi:MAG: molybdopterin oxidoreductase family protein [Deltaproteobacteria bacterium]|nr:molybdopterin oxidoreductase family protein [Deltaproteobacteria bacterium]
MATRTHYRACNLCEAICGLVIEADGDRILSIRGDREDPLSRGHICPKAVALQDIQNDPDRLKRPMRRQGKEWQEISWNEAFDQTAQGLKGVQERHGRDSVAVYAGNPTVHSYGSLLYGPAFVRTLGTRSRFSATSVDQLPHQFVAHQMFGHQLLLPIPDLDRTDFLLILGANPLASNGSLMTAPDVKKRLQAIRRSDGEIVVVDPRRTETAKLANHHFFIRPGADALFLAALLHTLFTEGLTDLGHLEAHTAGLDSLQDWVSAFPPQRVAGATGIDAEDIRQLAQRFAAADSAACYGRLGVSVHEFGSLCQWLITALNLVTGNLDSRGGAMFTLPAVDLVGAGRSRGHYGRWSSRVRDLPEFAGELPVAVLAEEMLTEGPGQIKALVTSAGNPVLSTPNGRQLEGALEGLEFMVSVDLYLNETTRHADLILPPTPPLERDHYDLAFHALSIRNTAKYSPPLFEPAEDARHDWQIFYALQQRLENKVSPLTRVRRHFLERRGPSTLLDHALRRGPRGSGFRPFGKGLTLKRLKEQVHGVDFGFLEPCLPQRLATKSRKIELAPEVLLKDRDRLGDFLEARSTSPQSEQGPFLLIGRRQVRSNNSWMHNYPRLMRGKARCTLLIHPQDAENLGLGGGESAKVTSRTGSIVVPVEVSDEVMPGVVSLPHGWGHSRPETRLQVASKRPGASLNDITDEHRVDPLCGNAALTGVPVDIERMPQAGAVRTPLTEPPRQQSGTETISG